jgi:hypothetical protein
LVVEIAKIAMTAKIAKIESTASFGIDDTPFLTKCRDRSFSITQLPNFPITNSRLPLTKFPNYPIALIA